jgi:hypothetical protein
VLASVRLYWIPVGAGQHVVRFSTRAFEALDARRHHRPRRAVYHAALEVQLDTEQWTVEMTPAWGGPASEHGVTVTGPVGVRRLGASRFFRYEVRVWRGGVVPDLGYAVGGPVCLETDEDRATELIAAGARVPGLTWGRDELDLGDMWNSNSLVAWLLASSGHDLDGLAPPGDGRAPGWSAGVELARRTGQRDRSAAASSSTPSMSLGPGRAHRPSASTARTVAADGSS